MSMSIASKIHPLRHLPTAALLLSLLCACSFYEYEDNTEADPVIPTEKYINLSIVVSSGNESTTRADETPKGGEDGDGREAGLERENEVTGITLMLYEAKRKTEGATDVENDITNATDDDLLVFSKYFPVTLERREKPGSGYDDKTDKTEAIYTTGDQPLKGTNIKTNTEYRVIVVANLDLSRTFPIGAKVTKVREEMVDKIFGEGNGIGVNAKKFVMSLEEDYTLNFSGNNATQKKEDNKLIYIFDNIRIERLAARVDFWMKGAKYQTNVDNSAYITPGYEYEVVNDKGQRTDDKFVLTAITPFNLYNENEYLFKRVNVGGKIKYLGSEDEFNSDGYKLQEIYVIDPKTNDKSLNTTIKVKYDNTLSSLLKLDDESNPSRILIGAGEYYLTTQMLHDNKNTDKTQSATFDGIGTADNFILCYPKENTLKSDSPLYGYATGVAIEGDYYKDGKGNPEHLIYYGYLRHQGEGSTAYSIKTAKELRDNEEQAKAGTEGVPMNFGVVRNNIYRISIEEITQKGEIKWQIKVKKWDKFTHSTIYM